MIAPVHIDRLWNAGLMTVLALACALAGYANWGMAEGFAGLAPSLTEAIQPAPPTAIAPPVDSFLPQQLQDFGRDQAHAYNLASPLEAINPAPPAFHAEWLSPPELERATDCMASAIYYEAASESVTGQLAVAQVILNRLRHPRYPKTICAVIHQGSERPTGCQFTYTCDGALSRPPDPARLQRARLVAQAALHGATSAQAGQATHYHTVWIVPVWAKDLRKVAIIGNHVFYRPPGAYPGYPMPSLPIAPALATARAAGATPSLVSATIEVHPDLVAAEKPQQSLANVDHMAVSTIADPVMSPLTTATAIKGQQGKENKTFRFGHRHRENGAIPLTGS